MAIDNFDIIKSFINFKEKDGLFLHIQIIRRGKDHPNLSAANKLIRSFFITDIKDLDKNREDIIFLCEHYKARAYTDCVPKSLDKLNKLLVCDFANNVYLNNLAIPFRIINSTCDRLLGIEKRWVVDIDTKDTSTLKSVCSTINSLCTGTWLIQTIPTLNGYHLITKPFNLQRFNEFFSDIEVKKNHITILYIPNSICNEVEV